MEKSSQDKYNTVKSFFQCYGIVVISHSSVYWTKFYLLSPSKN